MKEHLSSMVIVSINFYFILRTWIKKATQEKLKTKQKLIERRNCFKTSSYLWPDRDSCKWEKIIKWQEWQEHEMMLHGEKKDMGE